MPNFYHVTMSFRLVLIFCSFYFLWINFVYIVPRLSFTRRLLLCKQNDITVELMHHQHKLINHNADLFAVCAKMHFFHFRKIFDRLEFEHFGRKKPCNIALFIKIISQKIILLCEFWFNLYMLDLLPLDYNITLPHGTWKLTQVWTIYQI